MTIMFKRPELRNYVSVRYIDRFGFFVRTGGYVKWFSPDEIYMKEASNGTLAGSIFMAINEDGEVIQGSITNERRIAELHKSGLSYYEALEVLLI